MKKKRSVFGIVTITLGVLALLLAALAFAVLSGTSDASLEFYHRWNILKIWSARAGGVFLLIGVLCLIQSRRR